MRTWRLLATVLMSSAILLVGGQAAALAEEGDEEKNAELGTEVVKYLTMAAELAEHGEKKESPEALVTAGGLLLRVHAMTKSKTQQPEDPGTDEEGKKLPKAEASVGLEEQAEELFAKAKGMQDKLPGFNVNAAIKAIKGRTYGKRAMPGGPKQVTRKIGAAGTHNYNFGFIAHLPAGVSLQSSHPVRFVVIEPGVGTLFNSLVTTGHYTWAPSGKKGTRKVKIEVHGTNKTAQYRLTAN